ncbi:MAG TPA: hypothetical protein VIL24_05580 [Clostridia bacterium]
MKRFLLFLAFILIFIALGIVQQDLLRLRSRYPDMKVVFYTTDANAAQNHNSIFDGVYYEVTCAAKDAKKVKSALDEIKGMSVSFWGTQKDIDYILDYYRVKVAFETSQDQILYVYGYSDLISIPAVKVGEDYINIQLALRRNTVVVGAPFILGSI